MDPNDELIGLLNTEKAAVEDGKVVLTVSKPKSVLGPKGTDFSSRRAYRGRLESMQGPHTPFRRFKPIFVLCDEGTSDKNLGIVVEALEQVLDSVGMKGILPVHVFGHWHEGDRPHESIDWYIQNSYNPERDGYLGKGQCNLSQFWKDLEKDPVQKIRPHYDVVVLSDFDLYESHFNYRFLIGEGPEDGTILSITRYKDSGDEIVRQGALHEFGHTFARLSHCGKVADGKEGECTMKFPNSIPPDLEMQAEYRLERGVLFCDKHKLMRYKVFGRGFYCDEEHLNEFPEIQRLHEQIFQLNPAVLNAVDSGKLAFLKTRIVFV